MEGKTEALGEVTDITDPLVHVTHYHYDGRGNTTAVIDALGYETDTTYNYLDQPTRIQYPSTNGGTGRSELDFAYRFPNNATLSGSGPLLTTSLYNEASVLERQVNVTNGKESETTDVTGSGEVQHDQYNPFYALSGLGDGNNNTTGFSYDTNGNLMQMRFPLLDSASYGYDVDDNLTALLDGRGTQFAYNLALDDNRLTGLPPNLCRVS